MARGHNHVLGLDVGSWAVKAVELRRTSSGVELLGLPVVVPTPENAVEGGLIVDPDGVAAAIADAFARGGFQTKKAIASVGGESSVVVRIAEVANLSGKELDEAIHWELERQTPFPIENTYFDYQAIEPPDADPNAQNIEVLVAVAQEDMVDAHVSTMSAAKLVPVAIDVEPLAISRALVDIGGTEFANQTVGIVHIGATGSQILFIRNGLLAFVRLVPTAGNKLTQEIQQNFLNDPGLSEAVKKAFSDLSGAEYEQDEGYEEETGEELLGDDGADSVFEVSDIVEDESAAELGPEADATQLDTVAPQGAQMPVAPQADAVAGPAAHQDQDVTAAREIVYEAVATPIVELATEVRRSLDFYRRQHRNEEVDRIFLSGASASIPGLDAFIGAETGVHTEYANPFAYLITDEETQPSQYLKDIGPAMVVAVGLALQNMID